jgi:hypothetical protein
VGRTLSETPDILCVLVRLKSVDTLWVVGTHHIISSLGLTLQGLCFMINTMKVQI